MSSIPRWRSQKAARERMIEKKEAREAWAKLEPKMGPRRRPPHEESGTSECDCGHFWTSHGPQGCTLCPCEWTVPV